MVLKSGPLKTMVYALAVTLLCSACAGATASRHAEAQQPPQAMLLFQKTPCYGTCPAYDALVFEDGSITYVGYAHAPVQDTLQLCLPKPKLQQLKQAIQELHYSSLENSYLSQATDMPATYLTFFEDGKKAKRIKHQQGGPEALLRLQGNLSLWVTELAQAKARQ